MKRRYLDWRALTKKKQLQAELSLSSSSSSLVMKTEYDQSSPEHEVASLGSEYDQLLDLSGFPKDCHCDWPELVALSNVGGQSTMVLPGVKMEDDVSEYRVWTINSLLTTYLHSSTIGGLVLFVCFTSHCLYSRFSDYISQSITLYVNQDTVIYLRLKRSLTRSSQGHVHIMRRQATYSD